MTDVVMPQMGESIVEGTLTKWLKKPGDRVERDEPLFEISTDKVDTEIPSPVAGTMGEILVEEGKTVGINTVVGRISDGAGGGAAPAAAAPAPGPDRIADQPSPQSEPPTAPPTLAQPLPPQATTPREERAPAAPAPVQAALEEMPGPLSPLVRKMARENNIDLSKVQGTGAGGRITKQDLENYMAQGAPSAASPAPAPATAVAPAPAPAQQPPQPPQRQAVATIPAPVTHEAPAQFRGEAPS